MKIRRRASKCLNCERSIDEIYNFCPNCGQESTNRYVSFKDLVGEFFNNYMSFDSKFGRSILPFFFRPGKLTNEFINGRRVNYANPIRLYLIISLFHFFALSQFNNYKNEDGSNRGQVKFSLDKNEINSALTAIDTLDLNLSPNEAKVINQLMDSAKASLAKAADTLKTERDLLALAPDDTNVWPFENKQQMLIFYDCYKKLEISGDRLYDSLNIQDKSFARTTFIKQAIKLGRATEREMLNYFIENLPVLMFILLPLFALLLKLFYLRRNKYYIMHLIHALHIHSFAFLLLGISASIGVFIPLSGTAILYIFSATIIAIYVFASFINVYKQEYPKTILKYILYNFTYFILLSIGLTIQVFISLALF